MGWPLEALCLPQELKEAILSGKCVAFVGSGVSGDCYAPWCQLINSLCESCGSGFRVSDSSPIEEYLKAAQDAKDHDNAQYHAYLGETFGRPVERTTFLYDILLALPFKSYITVNLDPLLYLKATTSNHRHLPVFVYPYLNCQHLDSGGIFYIHGLIRENERPAKDSIVLAQREFDEAYRDNGTLTNFLLHTFEFNAVVFIGCGLREPVMPEVFAICRQNYEKRLEILTARGATDISKPPRFIFRNKPEKRNEAGEFDRDLSEAEESRETEKLKGMDIIPVWYVSSGKDHSALRFALQEIAKLRNLGPYYDYDWQEDPYENET